MKRVVDHPHASSELAENALYLERQESGLCDEFFDAAKRAEEEIAENPTAGRPYLLETRRVRMGKFAFGIVFREEREWIMIYAVASYCRKEGYWSERLP